MKTARKSGYSLLNIPILIMILGLVVLSAIFDFAYYKQTPGLVLSHTGLLYNVALAIIPSLFLYKYKNFKSETFNRMVSPSILMLFLGFIFMPNSFYIITDIIHVAVTRFYSVGYKGHKQFFLMPGHYLNLFNIFLAAVIGLVLGLKQIRRINEIIYRTNNMLIISAVTACESVLIGYAIYIGRFIRLNSWDIFSVPNILFNHNISKDGFVFVILCSLLVWIFNLAYSFFIASQKEVGRA
jgi:predicted membrane protein